ncbi:MAG: carbohydrate binding domain-containing protein [Treponema sp.]|nr:carbohydrate binding domain-containing protein [Treponema sp.]
MTINLYNSKKAAIQPDMTGLFFEDINYGADGGLYAELIENRNFENLKCFGGMNKGDWFTEPDYLYGWSPVGNGQMKVVSGSPLAQENPHYLRFTSSGAGDGFSNKAYDGICLKKGMTYNVSFYARNLFNPEQVESVIVSVLDKEGNAAAKAEISLEKNHKEARCFWKKYETVLTAERDLRFGQFTISLSGAGVVEFDFISMIPGDAVCGLFRKDLFDLLDKIHPGFIRFPGGCVIEGATLDARYNFKNTLKPLVHRNHNWSRWAVHHSWQKVEGYTGPECYPNYNQTLGMGYYEYFLLCEKLGCKALPVMNVGLACQFQSFEMVDVDSEEFEQYVQDAVDLVEFANGPVDSEWGKVRAELGHPEPFNLELMGIGNEQWETKDNRFLDRYSAFEKAIHAKYPEIKLIGSAGPSVDSVQWPQFNLQWDFIRKQAKTNSNFAYAVDEHYYMPPKWFLEHLDFYDNYDRNVKVFAGEYAAHPEGSGSFNNPNLNTLEGAVCEAAFMTGVERNADVVVLASYAPLFARMGYTQWSPDMIWFNDEMAYGTPSYLIQRMYGNYTGNWTLDTKNEQKALYEKGIYYNPSIKDDGTVFLKVANVNDSDVEIELGSAGFDFKTQKVIFVGGGEKGDVNSFEKPENVTIVEGEEKAFCGKVALKKNSFSVIVLC